MFSFLQQNVQSCASLQTDWVVWEGLFKLQHGPEKCHVLRYIWQTFSVFITTKQTTTNRVRFCNTQLNSNHSLLILISNESESIQPDLCKGRFFPFTCFSKSHVHRTDCPTLSTRLPACSGVRRTKPLQLWETRIVQILVFLKGETNWTHRVRTTRLHQAGYRTHRVLSSQFLLNQGYFWHRGFLYCTYILSTTKVHQKKRVGWKRISMWWAHKREKHTGPPKLESQSVMTMKTECKLIRCGSTYGRDRYAKQTWLIHTRKKEKGGNGRRKEGGEEKR